MSYPDAFAHYRQGQYAQALEALEPLLLAQAAPADALNLAAVCLRRLGRLAEAEAQLRRLIAQAPEHADAWCNLGNLLNDQRRPSEAQAAFVQALRIAPAHVDSLYNLGNLYSDDSTHWAQAEAMFQRVLAQQPTHVQALNNLGGLWMNAGLPDEGLALYHRVAANAPGNAALHSNLLYRLAFVAQNNAAMLEEARRWSARHEAPLRALRQPHANERTPGRRLRIGYLSPDFREHCQSLFTVPVLSHHDRSQFQIHCYANVAQPDALTQRLQGYADVWRDVHGLDDEQLAQRIRADGIDILVDLTMHMAHGRPLLFARKPAPVQIAWLAYPGTTGIEAMDYRLTDARLDPPGTQADYTERTLYLPEAFWCYDPLSTQPVASAPPVSAAGHITFGCLNSPAKFTDASLQLWARVLREVEGAQLLLLSHTPQPHPQFLRRLQAQGIDVQRVRFARARPRKEYLRIYDEIDICLDTFPCNGHTTSLDALWMGVPVVTRVGHTAVGRGGLSILSRLGGCRTWGVESEKQPQRAQFSPDLQPHSPAMGQKAGEKWAAAADFSLDDSKSDSLLGLNELAGETDDAFVDIAQRLARDLPRLAHWRQRLRPCLEASTLMDGAGFARALEAIYRQAWRAWCE